MPLHRHRLPIFGWLVKRRQSAYRSRLSWDETVVNWPRRVVFYTRLSCFGVATCTFFTAAAAFFPEHSIERIRIRSIPDDKDMDLDMRNRTAPYRWIELKFAT